MYHYAAVLLSQESHNFHEFKRAVSQIPVAGVRLLVLMYQAYSRCEHMTRTKVAEFRKFHRCRTLSVQRERCWMLVAGLWWPSLTKGNCTGKRCFIRS